MCDGNTHLSGDGLTVHPEEATLPGSEEVHGPRLHGMVRDVDLKN